MELIPTIGISVLSGAIYDTVKFMIDRFSVHENGDIHPLFHLDINYSGAGTYKLGIEN